MKRMFALVAILMTLLLAGCAYGSGGSSSNHNPAPSAAGKQGSDCGYSWNPCGGQSAQRPVASADAAPRGSASGCFLHVLNGVGVRNGSVFGRFSVKCNVSPRLMLIAARLQVLNSAGNWVDAADIYVYNAPTPGHPVPAPGVTQYHPRDSSQLKAECFTGTWRLEGHWAGVKGNGQPFPNPNDGDTPADWSSAPVKLVC